MPHFMVVFSPWQLQPQISLQTLVLVIWLWIFPLVYAAQSTFSSAQIPTPLYHPPLFLPIYPPPLSIPYGACRLHTTLQLAGIFGSELRLYSKPSQDGFLQKRAVRVGEFVCLSKSILFQSNRALSDMTCAFHVSHVISANSISIATEKPLSDRFRSA